MRLIETISRVVKGLTISSLKKNAFNYVDLETPITDDTFLTKSGSLLTIFEFKGISTLPGNEEIGNAMDKVTRYLRDALSEPGTTISIVKDKNDAQTKRFIEAQMRSRRSTVKTLKLDIQDILSSDVDELSKWATYERTYIALWTHMSAYSAEERKDVLNEMKEGRESFQSEQESALAQQDKKIIKPLLRDAVNPSGLASGLLDKHAAGISGLSHTFKLMESRAVKLNVDEACRAMKMQIEADTPERWKPITLGSPYIPVYQPGSSEVEQLDDLLYPRLDEQIATESHDPIDSVINEVAGKCYMSLFVSAWGRDIKNLRAFENALPKHIPYRINFLLNHGISGTQLNNMLGSFTYWMHSENKKIKAANEFIEQMDGDTFQLQVVITTTGETKRDIRHNVEAIKTAITEWGSTKLSVDPVSAAELYISSAVGASSTLPIESGLPNSEDMGQMLPLYGPTSQWDSGTMTFISENGKIMPFEPGSSLQEANSTAIIARPRMGKSVLANDMAIAFCTKGGLTRLPLYTSIDIGGSTDGALTMLIEALPPGLRHQVRSYQLQMDPLRYTYNILDLPLGASAPLPVQRNFIENMILMMVSDPGKEPESGMPELVTQLISEAYKYFCGPEEMSEWDTAEMSLIEYTSGLNSVIDDLIVELKLPVIENDTPMREVRDMLFDKGYSREAEIAQRYMVPTLDMLSTLTTDDAINRSFGDHSRFNVIGLFNARMQNAQRKYPILFGHTTFDTAGARVLSIDLTFVTEKNDEGEGLKQNTLMYSMALMIGTQKFFYKREHAYFFESRYREYQIKLIDEYEQDEKVLQLDEYHRASPSPQIRSIVKKIELEGPKTKAGIVLISQEVDHFHGSIANFSNIFILGQLSKNQIDTLNRDIGLTESEKAILRSNSKLHGPRPGGSSMLHRALINERTVSQLLKFPKGPIGLWGLATSGDDRIIRKRLSDRLGGPKAREVLARYYPVGSIKSEIDKYRNQESDQAEEDKIGILQQIEDKIIQQAATDGII